MRVGQSSFVISCYLLLTVRRKHEFFTDAKKQFHQTLLHVLFARQERELGRRGGTAQDERVRGVDGRSALCHSDGAGQQWDWQQGSKHWLFFTYAKLWATVLTTSTQSCSVVGNNSLPSNAIIKCKQIRLNQWIEDLVEVHTHGCTDIETINHPESLFVFTHCSSHLHWEFLCIPPSPLYFEQRMAHIIS